MPYTVKNRKTLSDHECCGCWVLRAECCGSERPCRPPRPGSSCRGRSEMQAVGLLSPCPSTLPPLSWKVSLMGVSLYQLGPRQHYGIGHLWPPFLGENPALAGGRGPVSTWKMLRITASVEEAQRDTICHSVEWPQWKRLTIPSVGETLVHNPNCITVVRIKEYLFGLLLCPWQSLKPLEFPKG